ncbi:MAG TPA: translation initiation factor IF-2 N-terminal domain-containing protein, partial [Thermoanaerobaculia bacterium]|nr:translation initiation factor IF-2 N-terminal domain-containing protein [Thermoanaerobaculia bacterium]
MAKVQVRDLAKQMGIPDKDLIFKLQSLGVQVDSPAAAIDHEVILAILTGKKLATRQRTVIMREEKPAQEKEKREIKPPRPIVKPPRKPVVAPPTEAAPPPPPPGPIIPEFIQAAEAEAAEQERAAREPKPPAAPEKPRVPAEPPAAPPTITVAAEPAKKPEAPGERPAAAAASPGTHASRERTISGATGPRARVEPGPRPNYANQQRVHAPASRPAGAVSAGAARPAGDVRPAGPPRISRPAGPGEAVRPGMRPGIATRPGAPRPGGRVGPMVPPPPSAAPLSPTARRKKADGDEERPEKKKTTGKRGKRTTAVEVDNELFTKGPFSANAVLDEDTVPETLPSSGDSSDEADSDTRHAPSTRRDSRKQAAPVTAKVLEFKRPAGKVTLSEGVTVKELADKLGVKANDLMKHLLMKKGLMVSINAPLGNDLAREIARDLGIEADFVTFEEAVELETLEKIASEDKGTGTVP